MDPWIILCPGQGAQAVGMAKAWCEASTEARAVFDQADKQLAGRLGAPLSELCFNGPAERLNQTDIAQPAIYTASVASWAGLMAIRQQGAGDFPLAALAGLSLGEYTALHLAGAFTFADGLELVALRGRAMQDAAEAEPGGMLALIGADEAQASQLADDARQGDVVVVANLNAPGQVVLSGHKTALDRAAKLGSERGLRSAALPVAGAFHSPLMAPAAERLAAALQSTAIRPPAAPVVSNVTARPHAGPPPSPREGLRVGSSAGRSPDSKEPTPGPSLSEGGESASRRAAATIADSIRRRLSEQLTSPVRWADGCRWMIEHARGEWHELAPGVTLAGLMRRIERSIKVITHDQPA